LPYLPGSGVKGVLRQAARELANGEWGGNTQGWTDTAISALFGHQAGETELMRGALSFWDVIPKLMGDTLAVDIMTPHQSHYYQKGENPHESGQPTPISFLTVPPQSGFVFYVQCDVPHLKRLAHELAEDNRWRELLLSAFQHAFDWLGFGAKTSVGYGAMQQDEEASQGRKDAAQKQAEAEQNRIKAEQEAARIATLEPWEQTRVQVLQEKLKDQKNEDVLLKALEAGRWTDLTEARRIAEEIAHTFKESKQWREKSEKKNPEKDQPYQKTLRVKKFL
jgi:CRISPR-associated protein Cmr6